MDCAALARTSNVRLDEFSDAITASIHDACGRVIARQSIVKYTPTQAYCVLSELDRKIGDNDIRVKPTDDDFFKLRLLGVETVKENRRLLPLFVQFHTVPEARPATAHLTDHLAESALGRFNLELKKNVTIDSFELSNAWRDEAGFIVTDRQQFVYQTFDAPTLIKSLYPSTDATIESYTEDDLDALLDFDNAVAGFNRDKFVEFFAGNADLFVAKGSGGIDGAIAGNDDRIFFLYAETLEIAHALLKEYIQKKKLVQVSIFCVKDAWECKPASSRTVYRRHTRSVPSNIKWSKVFAINMGLHIV